MQMRPNRIIAVAATLMAMQAAGVRADLAASRERLLMDPAAGAAGVRLQGGEVKFSLKVQPDLGLTGGPARVAELTAGARGAEFWLLADAEIPADTARISWWLYTRATPWAEIRIVLESPDGAVATYRAPSAGDSAWTRYAIDWATRGDPIRVLERKSATGQWRFRGWTFRYQAFNHGRVRLGPVTTSARPIAADPDMSWSLRDVDESISEQSAYSGFRVGLDGTDVPPAVPAGLMVAPARRVGAVHTMSWQIADSVGRIVAVERQPVAPDENRDALLPVLPAGTYWIRVKLCDEAGTLLKDWYGCYLIHRNRAPALPATAAARFDIFWPGQGQNAIELKDLQKVLTVPVSGLAPGDQVQVVWRDATRKDISQNIMTFAASGEATITLPQEVRGPAAYWLTLGQLREGKILDQRTMQILIPGSPPTFALSKPFESKRERFFSLRETDVGSVRADQWPAREAFINHCAQTGSTEFMCFNWDELEPREGLLLFPLMDQRIERAAAAGVPVIPTLFTHLDRVPSWLWLETMLDQGLQNRHYSASFIRRTSPVAARAPKALAETARQIVRRYRDCPAIAGWNFSQGIESFWSDASRNGYVVDYSASARNAFAAYLKDNGWTLEKIAEQSGRAIGSWDQVEPPAPNFDDALDLRPLWLAFEDFKQAAPARYFEPLFAAIRSEDPRRPIYQYSAMGVGDLTCHLDVFKRHQASVCFGGSESSISPFFESLCLQYGVPLDAESAAVPPYAPSLALTLFNKLSHGGIHGGFNIMWGRHFDPQSQAHIDGAAMAARWADVVSGVGDTRPVDAGLAIGVGTRSIINRTRSFMWIDWMNLPARSYGLAPMLAQTVGGSAHVGFVTDHTPLEQLQRWPAILFMEAPILEDAARERLLAYVRGGGTLILQGETGRYDAAGRETWALRTALGDPKPDAIIDVGKGRVKWLSTPVNWNKTGACESAAGWAGYRPPMMVTPAQVRHALRRSADGNVYQAVLLYKTWEGGNPKSENLNMPAVRSQMKLPVLPEGASWRIRDLGSGENLGSKTSAELRDGMPVETSPGVLRILELRREN